MRWSRHTSSWASALCLGILTPIAFAVSPTSVSLQEDGSLVILNPKGGVADFVKQGTPRQSVEIGGQTCNVSYGLNSAGKKTLLLSLPGTATAPVVLDWDKTRITVPRESVLRVTLASDNRVEKMDGNPAESVQFETLPVAAPSALPPPPTQSSPTPAPPPGEAGPAMGNDPSMASPAAISLPVEDGWPGKLLETPIPASQMEEEMFFARTDLGVRFMSSLTLVGVSGPQAGVGNYVQKQFAFGTGYRQDFDVGVQLIDWFGLSFETGFALNSVRGNTEGMNVSDGTFWTFPFMAQLCFQYPNESGWIPYLNFGFGGAVTVLKLGEVTYTMAPGANLSGTGNCVTNAYQIAAGVRYRLYEDLSITLGYKFYGNSQGTVNLNNGVQLGLGSPVTNSAELGVQLAF